MLGEGTCTERSGTTSTSTDTRYLYFIHRTVWDCILKHHRYLISLLHAKDTCNLLCSTYYRLKVCGGRGSWIVHLQALRSIRFSLFYFYFSVIVKFTGYCLYFYFNYGGGCFLLFLGGEGRGGGSIHLCFEKRVTYIALPIINRILLLLYRSWKILPSLWAWTWVWMFNLSSHQLPMFIFI